MQTIIVKTHQNSQKCDVLWTLAAEIFCCFLRHFAVLYSNILRAFYRFLLLDGYYINYMSPYGEKEVYPAEYFLESVDVEFNGLMVKAPKEYHKILTKVYGDYMQLPPEERITTHCVRLEFLG
jgi:hypothetical protein